MGVLTKEQIGIEAPFGSAMKVLTFLAELTAGRGEGFGARRWASAPSGRPSKYGRPCRSVLREFPAYDSRVAPGHGPGLRHFQPWRLPPAPPTPSPRKCSA